MAALSPGARLGSFEILAPIGAGGMGDVYKARDTRLERVVAIKVLTDALAGDVQSRERFDREARAIFFYSFSERLMATPVTSTEPFALGSPVPLFQIRMLSGPVPVLGHRAQFDVAKDGRFLVNLPVADAESPPINVVLNWAAGLNQ